MFKLHRNKAARSGENIDFRFSQLKALQVPKGWDRLFVSILSCQTGKTIAKSSKALVRNGTCQWTEDITESIWVSQDDSSKEFEDCLYKLVLATGSARSGILGEATINITSYVNSATSVSVLVPLKKCNSGTTLQLKIQCLTPRTDTRDDEHIETGPPIVDPDDNSLDSEGSHDKEVEAAPHQEQLRVRVSKGHLKEMSYSSSGSRHSSDENISTTLSNGGGNSNGEEQYDIPNLRSLRNTGSSKDLIEAAEDTIAELRKESKMWERNTQKLMLDLEILREEFADQSKQQTNLEVELSAAKAERDGLRNQVERMNLVLEKSGVEDEEHEHRKQSQVPVQKELEEEMRFQKERNDHLALQLSRSQESNIELVSVLQELEEIVEKQKAEIENLVKKDQSGFDDLERLSMLQLEENKIIKELEESKKDLQAKYESELSSKEEEIVNLRAKLFEFTEQSHSLESDMVKEMELLKEKLQELERDCNELTEENLDLLFKLKEMNGGSNQGASATYELASIDYSAKSVSSSSDHDGGEYCHEDKSKKKMMKESDSKLDLISIKDEKSKLEEMLLLKESEIEDLHRVNVELQENLQAMQRESEVTLKCLSDLQNDLSVLSSSFDSHVSANKILERKTLDLESRNSELEFHLSELDRENAQLSDWVSGLEAETMNLRDEIDSNRVEIKQKEQTLEIENGELRKKNLDLESKVKVQGDCLEKCSVKVETLEESLSLLMEDVALKDKKLSSELHGLLDKNKEQEDRISELKSLVEFKENEFETKVRESDKLKTSLNEIELRLTVSEYERQKLAEQATSLKIQLQEMEKLKFEKEKDEASLEAISREYNDLKDENNAFHEKISVMEKVLIEFEDCRESRIALEEKVVSLEEGLMASESLRAEAADVASEIGRIRKESREYQQIARRLEEERDELANKVLVLEDELKVIKEENKKHKHYQSSSVRNIGVSKANSNKSEIGRSNNKQRDGRRKPPSKDVGRDQQSPSITIAKHKIEDDRISNMSDEGSLTEITDTEGPYKPPHNRLGGHAGQVVSREKLERTKSSLEAELIELRERYSYMSLKYAQVEAEREELVMKMKVARPTTVKRWFSS